MVVPPFRHCSRYLYIYRHHILTKQKDKLTVDCLQGCWGFLLLLLVIDVNSTGENQKEFGFQHSIFGWELSIVQPIGLRLFDTQLSDMTFTVTSVSVSRLSVDFQSRFLAHPDR